MRIDKDGVQFVSKLTRLTVEGHLSWEKNKRKLPLTEPGELSSALYTASWQDMVLVLYRVKHQVVYGDDDPGREWVMLQPRIVLEIRDGDGDSVLEFSYESVVDNLFDAVRASVSGFKKRFADLMSEGVTHAQ